MIVVCGAPGSGKSTYVRERIKRGEMAVDVDLLFSALTMRPLYDKPANLVASVLTVRDYLIEAFRPAYVISSDPTTDFRNRMRAGYGATIVVIETPAEECIRRLAADPRRDDETDWPGLVSEWWQQYERAEGDEVVI